MLRLIDDVMTADPKYWRDYVADGPRARLERLFGLSDRIRYYWPNPAIQEALGVLHRNIDAASDELGLIRQFPNLWEDDAHPGLSLSQRIIQARVGAVVAKYVGAS
jgi:D-tagatose-1,6-bisphosphate aldolase subunit GatZ/KbaZ